MATHRVSLEAVAVKGEPRVKRFRLRWYDADGKRHAKILGRSDRLSKSDAAQIMREFEESMIQRPSLRSAPKRSVRLQELADKFLEDWSGKSRWTVIEYRTTLRRLAERFGADARITSISRGEARAWANTLEGDESIAQDTARKQIGNAKTVFRHAVDLGFLHESPFAGLSSRRGAREPDFKLPIEGVRKLLEHAPDDSWRALIALTGMAALRVGEACRLEWADVDWSTADSPTRMIRVKLPDGRATTKRRYRVVMMEPELESILLAIHSRSDGALVVKPVYKNTKHYAPGLRRLIAAAGLKQWPKPFHDLRGACISRWLDEHRPHYVARWAGHSVRVQRDHYAAVPEEAYTEESPAVRIKRLEAELAERDRLIASIRNGSGDDLGTNTVQ